MAEYAERPGAGAILFARAAIEHVLHEGVVLAHGHRGQGRRPEG